MPTIAAKSEADCSPEVAVRHIYEVLGGRRPGEFTKTLRVGAIARDVNLTLGDVDRKPPVIRIRVSWVVPDSNAFPEFHGLFDIQAMTDGKAAIALLGYYHPPFGAIGAVFDAVAGRWIAMATISQLLGEITKSIERERARG